MEEEQAVNNKSSAADNKSSERARGQHCDSRPRSVPRPEAALAAPDPSSSSPASSCRLLLTQQRSSLPWPVARFRRVCGRLELEIGWTRCRLQVWNRRRVSGYAQADWPRAICATAQGPLIGRLSPVGRLRLGQLRNTPAVGLGFSGVAGRCLVLASTERFATSIP